MRTSRFPRIPMWATVTAIVVVIAAGVTGGSAWAKHNAEVALTAHDKLASEVTSAANDTASAGEELATQVQESVTAQLAAEAKAKADAAAAAQAAADAAAAQAAADAAAMTKAPANRAATGGATGPVTCPAGSTAQGYDGANNATACIPDICMGGIGGPGQPTNEQCVVFKP